MRRNRKKLKRKDIVKSLNKKIVRPKKRNNKAARPHFYILTRTSNRPKGFKRNHESIRSQTYSNWTHLVSIDDLSDKKYVSKYNDLQYYFVDTDYLNNQKDIPNPNTGKRFPYNLYFNVLLSKIKGNGWIIYLDDDDYFKDKYSLQKIAKEIKAKNDIIVWQMQFNDNLKIPRNFSTFPKLFDVGAPCISVHSSIAKKVKWDGWKCGDYRYIKNVSNIANITRVINESLVSIGGVGSGLKKDIGDEKEISPKGKRRRKSVNRKKADGLILNSISQSNDNSEESRKKKLTKIKKRIQRLNKKNVGVNKPNVKVLPNGVFAKMFTQDEINTSLWLNYDLVEKGMYSVEHTYHFMRERLLKDEPFTYLRFGDNDFMHVLKVNVGKALGHNRTVYNDNLHKHLKLALNYNSDNYIKTYNFANYSNWHKTFKSDKLSNLNRRVYDNVKKIDDSKYYHHALFFYIICKSYPSYVQGIFKPIINSNKKLFVGSLPNKYTKNIIGDCKLRLKTESKNATANIDYYIGEIDKILQNNDVRHIVLAAGQLSRVLGGYINRKYGNDKYFILDVGGVIEAFYPESTKSSVVRDGEIYRENFNFNHEENILSLTMLPERLPYAKECIKSLLCQSSQFDSIEVWLPKVCIRTGKKTEKIPEYLNNYLIDVNLIDDLGSISKLYFSAKKYNDLNKEVNIITVDDDVKYPYNFVKTFDNCNEKGALCYRGRKSSSRGYNFSKLYKGTEINKSKKIDIITGTWGARYKTSFFSDNFFDLPSMEAMKYTDDIWISYNMKENNIPMWIIPINGNIKPLPHHNVSSLWEHNKNGKNNNEAIKYMNKKIKNN